MAVLMPKACRHAANVTSESDIGASLRVSYLTPLLAGKKKTPHGFWLLEEWAYQEGMKRQKSKRQWAKYRDE